MLSGLKRRGLIGTSLPLSTSTWGNQGDKMNVCLQVEGPQRACLGPQIWLQECACKSFVPNHPWAALMVSRELLQTKKKTLKVISKYAYPYGTQTVYWYRFFKHFHSIPEWFYDSMWFKIIRHVRCWLWGLYQKLIFFTDLRQCLFFKINQPFFTTADKIDLGFMIILGI